MKLAVLGAGSWGLTLTKLLTDNFEEISVWSREEDLPEELVKTKSIKFPVEVSLDNKIEISSNLEKTIKDAQIILLVVSTSGVRPVCKLLKNAGIKADQTVVNTSKGLELPTLYRMSEVITQELPGIPFAVLSGPTLAKEVLKGLPTAAVVASPDKKTADFVQENLNVTGKFRLYTNEDVVGVELGGSLKNVIAIASGFVDAMGLGDNARGALLTRGLAEIVRISVALGANPITLYGLSGVGDLIATCSSPLSRNFSVGYRLGQGKKIDDILKELGVVAEGVKTTEAVCQLASKLNLSAPVANIVKDALYTDISPEEVVYGLMSRPLTSEDNYKFEKAMK